MAIVDLAKQEPPQYVCANCRRWIGALEQPYQWGEHVICADCLAAFQAPAIQQIQVPPQPLDPLDQLAHSLPQPHVSYQSHVHYHAASGSPDRRRPGSATKNSGGVMMLVALPLLCLFWPVGLILFVVGFVMFITASMGE